MAHAPDHDTPVTESEIRDILLSQVAVPPDPSKIAPYPRGLALDLALQTAPLPEILSSYQITAAEAKKIFANPAFRLEYDDAVAATKQEGYSFRRKAAAQAEAYLEVLWGMANSPLTPAPVRADIIKSTVKWGALDSTPAQSPAGGDMFSAEALKNLQSMPDQELEVSVMKIIARKTPKQEVKTVGHTIEAEE